MTKASHTCINVLINKDNGRLVNILTIDTESPFIPFIDAVLRVSYI